VESPAPPVPPGRRFPVGLAALSVALAAAIGVITWDRFHRPDSGPDLPLRKFDLVLADLTPGTFPVISPDGQKIVYNVPILLRGGSCGFTGSKQASPMTSLALKAGAGNSGLRTAS